MRILPVTNTQILQTPSFRQKADKSLSREEAQTLLDNPESITREHFKDGYIYTGLSKLYYDLDLQQPSNYEAYCSSNYKDMEQLYERNRNNFKKLYVHALVDLGLKVEELRMDVAMDKAAKEKNRPLLKLMVQGMHMRPVKPDGQIDSWITYKCEKCCKDDENDMFSGYYWGGSIYGKYVPPVKDTSIVLEQAKNMINHDEEKTGQVSLDTIHKIVSKPDFAKIKDEDLNISGSKILHILSDAPFNKDDEKEVNIVKDIIKKCADAGYDFNIKNEFGETAVDKAVESENSFLAEWISKGVQDDNTKN